MTAALTPLPIKDGNAATRSRVAIDLSGTGAGPWVFADALTDDQGTVIAPAKDATVLALGVKLDTLHADLATTLAGLLTASNGYTDGLETLEAAIRDRLPATLGQKNAAGSLSVVLSSDGPFATNFGITTDAAVTDPTATASLIALIKGLISLERPIQGASVLTPSDAGSSTVGRQLAVTCTVAGNVSVVFADATTHVFPVSVGYSVFPFAVSRVNSTGTTATATYANLK